MFVDNCYAYIIKQNKITNVYISDELQIQETSEDLLLGKNCKILSISKQELESSDAQTNKNEIKNDLLVTGYHDHKLIHKIPIKIVYTFREEKTIV